MAGSEVKRSRPQAGEPFAAGQAPTPLILTASDRLARALREDHSLNQRAAGRTVWEAPRIQTLQHWLLDRWAQSWPQTQLLHPVQELALWRQVIEQDDRQPILAPLIAARQARQAEQLALEYGIDLTGDTAAREEHQAFRRWQAEVQKRRGREGWITAAELPRETASLIRQRRVELPASVRLAGFLGPLPAGQRLLFDTLSAAGVNVGFLPFQASAAPATQRRCYVDAEAQFRAIGQAIRQQLQPYRDHQRPPPRIVLAMPEPEARRELIETIFRPLLAPWVLQPDGLPPALPWRWERGRPLQDQPWIEAALSVCECEADGTGPEVISRLLLSPALWSETERELSAQLDYELRKSGVPLIRSARLLAACPEPLRPRVTAFARLLDSAPRRALPSAWAALWQARLDALHWPGASALDSDSFQAVREWPQLLARLSSMDRQTGRLPQNAALGWLKELARAPHSARVEHLQPVILMSLEDATGLNCDRLFIADVSADRFPGRALASPYLPLPAQAAAGAPGATPALQLEQAQRLATHLQELSPHTWLTMAQVDERGAELRPAPVFGAGEWPQGTAPGASCRQEQDSEQAPRVSRPPDDAAPPVSPTELAGLRADARLFRLWFASPFFAFCQYRLGVEPLPSPSAGLRASDQGNVLHAVLEDLWGELKDSAGLRAAGDEQLADRIQAALNRQLPWRMPASEYGAAQVRLEQARMADVLLQWLRHEKRRADPFTVVQREASLQTTVAGLPLTLRPDRVDRVRTKGGERWLVMDYKTGRKADAKDWNMPGLTEPQLPLYASFAAPGAIPQADGIGFGHLKDGHPVLIAKTNWPEFFIAGQAPRNRDAFDAGWQGTLAAWRKALQDAAAAFLSGDASFDPALSYRGFEAEFLALAGDGLREDDA